MIIDLNQEVVPIRTTFSGSRGFYFMVFLVYWICCLLFVFFYAVQKKPMPRWRGDTNHECYWIPTVMLVLAFSLLWLPVVWWKWIIQPRIMKIQRPRPTYLFIPQYKEKSHLQWLFVCTSQILFNRSAEVHHFHIFEGREHGLYHQPWYFYTWFRKIMRRNSL